MLVKIEQYEGGKTIKLSIYQIIYVRDNLYQNGMGFSMGIYREPI